MKLLKIGPLWIGKTRWLAMQSKFDHMHVVKSKRFEKDEISDPFIEYHNFDDVSFLNTVLTRLLRKIKNTEPLRPISATIIVLLRAINKRWIKTIASLDFDKVHISCHDFDDSGWLSLVLSDAFGDKPITRSYKESRPGYDYCEKMSFLLADRIVLNHEACIEFFERKYGKEIFSNKTVVTSLDEDWVGNTTAKQIQIQEKMSKHDGRKHAIILAGRVMSDPGSTRSGSRLYYIPLIKKLVDCGIIVHLNTKQIIADPEGIDQYEVLERQLKGNFIIDDPFDFHSEETAVESYGLMSRYDYGVMHCYIDGTSNSEFDKYNIPHRYYEYQFAEVFPIQEKGRTIVLEDLLKKTSSGIIYENPRELLEDHEIVFHKPRFEDYVEALY